jgi:hypothetical protein
MNTDCSLCHWKYYERDTNYRGCKHPDFNEDEPDKCPGEYSEADAKADARYGDKDGY